MAWWIVKSCFLELQHALIYRSGCKELQDVRGEAADQESCQPRGQWDSSLHWSRTQDSDIPGAVMVAMRMGGDSLRECMHSATKQKVHVCWSLVDTMPTTTLQLCGTGNLMHAHTNDGPVQRLFSKHRSHSSQIIELRKSFKAHTLRLAPSDTFPDPFFRTATLIVSVQEPRQILRRLSCWVQSMHGTVCIRAAGLDGILQAGAFGSLSRGNLPSFWLNAACHTCLLACFFFLVDCTHMWPQHLGHAWPFRQRFSFGSRCIPECT